MPIKSIRNYQYLAAKVLYRSNFKYLFFYQQLILKENLRSAIKEIKKVNKMCSL